ncbi:MAG: acyl-CoA thioesterase [Deltaproteobacteria bacterium]|nr:MAG: acyl-CoA thioesterase [Deltaproteobacteria bacterium]
MAKRFHEEVMGVYFDDLDSFHILHNARYLLLFERTLGAFWMEVFGGSFNDTEDRFHFVRTNNIEYIRPVAGVGRVRVRVWVERLGRSSLTFGFRILPMHEDSDHAVGSRTVVRVDAETQRPVPWSDAFRTQMAPWIEE